MKSTKIDNDLDFKRKLLWCLFWANRKAIRTEGCAPFLVEKIVTSEATYAPEIGNILKLSNDLLQKIENEMEGGRVVEIKITIGDEKFDLSFQKNVFSVSTRRNKEIEEEIIESLNDDMKKGKPKICPSFPQRVGVDIPL
ncbi:MAG: hypothetical protein IBX41_07505 [Methanophagales archaeon]|nr:hypothetical protein [Methanophagales archaeon]